MKKIIYLLTALVFILLICLVFCFPKSKFNIEKRPDIQLHNIEKLIQFSGYQLDLKQSNGIITYGELIALTGKTARKADLTPEENEKWFEPYINLAKKEGWIGKEFEDVNNYSAALSRGDALNVFIQLLEKTGQETYPVNISSFNEEGMNNNLLKAYTKGLYTFKSNNLSSYFTKGEAYEVVDMLINPSKRIIPFHLQQNQKNILEISNYQYPSGKFFSGEKIQVLFDIKNLSLDKKEIWINAVIKDALGKEYRIPVDKKNINTGKTVKYNLEWKIPEKLLSGDYIISLALFDKDPDNQKASAIGVSEIIDQLIIYNQQEEFKNINTNVWKLSSHTLGRTSFSPANATAKDGILTFKIPGNTFESSELQSVNFMGYGSYEIRMKIPDAPGSITGFFMYKAPDYYHEIDIEIYNQKSGDYFLTTYADGDKQKEFFGVTPFDPTLDFNTYRFDYYPDKLDYYINDIFVIRFTEGYSKEEMYLMVNSWYPNWVKGGPAKEDKYFYADWIRY